jgi:hypothetical protein
MKFTEWCTQFNQFLLISSGNFSTARTLPSDGQSPPKNKVTE